MEAHIVLVALLFVHLDLIIACMGIHLVLSSVITPPDMFSQLMLTGPLYFLYEVSIVVVRIVQRKKSREEQK